MRVIKISVMVLLPLLLTLSCKKNALLKQASAQNSLSLQIGVFGNHWDQLVTPDLGSNLPPNTDMYNLSFAANDKVYVVLRGYNQLWQYDPASNLWSLFKTNFFNFTGYTGYTYAFTNGDNIYFISASGKNLKQYNLASGLWSNKTNFPGAAGYGFTATFTTTKGYILGGANGSDANGYGYTVSENWEYDFAANTWTLKANTPGLGRYNAASYAVSDKLYFGTGISVILIFNPTTFQAFRVATIDADWYEYNTTTNTWTRKADFGGGTRQDTRGFVIGSTVYLGLGSAGYFTDIRSDLWSYNPSANTWAARASYPPGNGYPPYLTMVGAASHGYAVLEDVLSFWRYTGPYTIF